MVKDLPLPPCKPMADDVLFINLNAPDIETYFQNCKSTSYFLNFFVQKKKEMRRVTVRQIKSMARSDLQKERNKRNKYGRLTTSMASTDSSPIGRSSSSFCCSKELFLNSRLRFCVNLDSNF